MGNNNLWKCLQYFQYKDTNSINKCNDKNTPGCKVFVGIYINGKEDNIRQQGKRPDGSDQPAGMDELG
jgi:hypothetical protein